MIKRLLAFSCFTILLWTTPSHAVQFIQRNADGSLLFKCELEGAAHRVSVKARGHKVYQVLTIGSGRSGFNGKLLANSPENAARKGCGELEIHKMY